MAKNSSPGEWKWKQTAAKWCFMASASCLSSEWVTASKMWLCISIQVWGRERDRKSWWATVVSSPLFAWLPGRSSHSPETVSLKWRIPYTQLPREKGKPGHIWRDWAQPRDFCFLFLQLKDDSGGVGLNITTNFKNSLVMGLKPAAFCFFLFC